MTEIDVSKCAFYSKGKCNNPNGMACNCRNTAICYFKELKRLEQKLEKIKEAITTCLTFHTCQKCKFYKECEMSLEEFILEVIRGAER